MLRTNPPYETRGAEPQVILLIRIARHIDGTLLSCPVHYVRIILEYRPVTVKCLSVRYVKRSIMLKRKHIGQKMKIRQ